MKLAVQLFTLRDLLEQDLVGTLEKVSYSGYHYVETAGFYGRTAKEFRQLLEDCGLEAIACHVGLGDVENDLAATAKSALDLGASWLVVPWIGKADYESGWAQFGKRLGEISESVIQNGLKFAYHNHDFEFADENGEPGFQILWNSAPETVEVELDVYWAEFAGFNPESVLRNLAGRVPLVHFKDGKGGKHTPVGQGDLDWDGIIKACKTIGSEYAIVELDDCPKDPIECIAESYDFLTGLDSSLR